jgi:hypothetical protein
VAARAIVRQRREAGLCKCGRQPVEGMASCSHHLEIDRKAAAKKVEARRATKRCLNCSANTGGGVRCAPCQSRYREFARNRQEVFQQRQTQKRHQRRESGNCPLCGKPIEAAGRCLRHWLRLFARNSTGIENNADAIARLLEGQQGACIYTGAQLKPGVNASLDHKTPKVRGGKNEIPNLQWVTALINRMKAHLTHEEFIAICRLIVARADGSQVAANPQDPVYAMLFDRAFAVRK